MDLNSPFAIITFAVVAPVALYVLTKKRDGTRSIGYLSVAWFLYVIFLLVNLKDFFFK